MTDVSANVTIVTQHNSIPPSHYSTIRPMAFEASNEEINPHSNAPSGLADTCRDLSEKARPFTTTTPTTHKGGLGIDFSTTAGKCETLFGEKQRTTTVKKRKQHMASTSYESRTTTHTPRSCGHNRPTTEGLSGWTFQRAISVSAVFPNFDEIMQLMRTQDVVLGGVNKTTESAFFFFFSAGTASDSQRPPAVFSGASGWFHRKVVLTV